MINAGTYILEPDVLSSIPPQTNFSFEHEVFPPLLEREEPIYAYPSFCYWMDIGTPQKYLQLNHDLLNGKSNQYSFSSANRVLIGEQSNSHPTAKIIGPAVTGSNFTIGRNARLTGPVVIGPNSTIGKGAIVEDCVIWHNVNIEPGAVVRRSIIANDCHIGAGSIVEDSVISDNVTIAASHKLEPGSKIWPDTRLY
jgi:mannose-1-phosphate guanylyltransferase